MNFPTKTTWRKPSEYSYVEEGLKELVNFIQDYNIQSIAIPALGAGNGGLEWNEVKKKIECHLGGVACDVIVYLPNVVIKEDVAKEKVSLTPARAMLLAVLYDLVKQGEFISEFSAEKIAYFLQRFGADSEFKLEFKPYHYGPYSGKVKHVLYYLNGSYITGYSSKDKRPFDVLDANLADEQSVLSYLKSQDHRYLDIVEQTQTFLSGYYSNFGLELLSTIDYIKQKEGGQTIEEISSYLKNWNSRKQRIFANDLNKIALGLKHLEQL